MNLITESNDTIWLFKINSTSLPQFNYYKSINTRIYKFEVTNCDVIERSFIPCYSTTTVIDVDGIERPKGTIGMYDTVEGKFYTNQGDPNKGDFGAGHDVN